MEIIRNNGTFFDILNRNAKSEYLGENIRKPSLANTTKNESQFQLVQNLSRNYMRTGNQIYADPFAFHMRPNNFSYDGRRVAVLDTLEVNATRDKPDVITLNPLKVVGYY
jgi:hypothetical protein